MEKIPWDAPKPWRNPVTNRPFLDPSKDYPNGLGLSNEEIEEGLEFLLRHGQELKRQAEEKKASKEAGGGEAKAKATA